MEFTGVYHKTSEQMSYALNEDELVINLKTGYDVKRVFIHYGDPFEAGILGGNEKWTGKREEIVYKKRLPNQRSSSVPLLPDSTQKTIRCSAFAAPVSCLPSQAS